MKRKKILSTHDYIHVNKNTITVGRKGTQKMTLKKSEIIGAFATIQQESIRLSKQGTRNTKIPSFFGLSGDVTSIVRDEFRMFNDLMQGKNLDVYNPKLVIARFQRLQRLKKPRLLAKDFFKEIRKYYGVSPNTSEKTLRDMYRKGRLYNPVEDIGRLPEHPPNYYARMQEWVDNNIPGAREHWVIADDVEFRANTQRWEESKRTYTLDDLKAYIDKAHII